MGKKIYQIQLSLNNFKPKIWRRLLVPSNMLLHDFHLVIQTTMGWTNSHLHQFTKGQKFYMYRMTDDEYWDKNRHVDYKRTKISDLLTQEKENIVYEYDFGDSWHHDITLEKILSEERGIYYPVCLKGKWHCPPEDCGGVWGYAELLEILKNPKNKEYESYIEWLGDEFDPEFFDVNGSE